MRSLINWVIRLVPNVTVTFYTMSTFGFRGMALSLPVSVAWSIFVSYLENQHAWAKLVNRKWVLIEKRSKLVPVGGILSAKMLVINDAFLEKYFEDPETGQARLRKVSYIESRFGPKFINEKIRNHCCIEVSSQSEKVHLVLESKIRDGVVMKKIHTKGITAILNELTTILFEGQAYLAYDETASKILQAIHEGLSPGIYCLLH